MNTCEKHKRCVNCTRENWETAEKSGKLDVFNKIKRNFKNVCIDVSEAKKLFKDQKMCGALVTCGS